MKKIWLIFILFAIPYTSFTQELMANVQVIAPQVPNINKRNTDLLQNIIREFLNNTKWTTENYQPQERINCNLIITITAWDGNAGYKAEAQIQSTRPVYGSDYSSILLNYIDKDFDFSFIEGQPLDFSEQNYISNLSSLLGFYANTIIGLDKDSFSKLGGTPYYSKALTIINYSQNSGTKGWRAGDGLRNRFWLNQNLQDFTFNNLRAFIYDYHRNGLDLLQERKNQAANSILNMLSTLQQLDKQKMGSIFPNIYLAAKADEVINVLKLTELNERVKAFNILTEIDPANQTKYQSMIQQ